MYITFVFATTIEAQGLLDWLRSSYQEKEAYKFQTPNGKIDVLITGVGAVQTALTLGLYLVSHRPDMLVNAGIAGAFSESFQIGAVVQVVSERFGDFGVQNADASFTDWAEMGWADGLPLPIVQGEMHNPEGAQSDFLPKAKGLTVQKVHGTAKSIAEIKGKYPQVQVESMEGAAFFLACLQTGRRFLEIRAISNKVEPRNKENWDIGLALKNLHETLKEIVISTMNDE